MQINAHRFTPAVDELQLALPQFAVLIRAGLPLLLCKENLIKQRKGFACKWHILRKHPNTVEGFSHSSSNNTIAGIVRNPQTMKDDSSTHGDVEKSNTFYATCVCVCAQAFFASCVCH